MSEFGHLQLSEHFQLREFRCKGTLCACQGAFRADERLVALVEAVRQYIAQPIRVTSGFRCALYNAAVDGFPNSNHIQGLAADLTSERIRADLKNTAMWIGGIIGDFTSDGGNVIYYLDRHFIHVDVGPTNWPTVVRSKEGSTK